MVVSRETPRPGGMVGKRDEGKKKQRDGREGGDCKTFHLKMGGVESRGRSGTVGIHKPEKNERN